MAYPILDSVVRFHYGIPNFGFRVKVPLWHTQFWIAESSGIIGYDFWIAESSGIIGYDFWIAEASGIIGYDFWITKASGIKMD